MRAAVFKKVLTSAMIPLISSWAMAQTVVNPASIARPTAATPVPVSEVAPLPTDISSGTGGNAAQSAQQASDSMSGAMIASAVMAAVLASQCNPPTNIAPCIMAPMAAAQAASLAGTAGGASDSQTALSSGVGAPGATPAPPVIGSIDGSASQIANGALQTLASKGVTVNPDGSVTLADGTNIPTSAAGGAAAQAADGFTPAQIEAGKVSLAEAQAKTKEKLKSLALSSESSGGGGGGGYSAGVASSLGYSFGHAQKKRAKPSLAGMSKNLGGDKIGVAGDNIFEMVTRRYKARDSVNNFFKN